MKKYPHVFSPIRVGGVVLKNRIISAPSTVHTASSGQPYPTEEGIRFFEDRAKAGAGLVTCAGVSVGGANDDGVHASWDLKVPNHTNRLVDLSERIHLYGAKCTMELIGVFPEGYTVSDGCSIMGSPPIGREIPKEKMMWFKDEYVEAALGIKAAGFDGVLLHMGHSIPVAQFFSPYTNKRTDEYGGSTENRCRYAVEILSAIRKACGPDFIIDVRISGTEYQEGGIDIEEGLKIAEILQEHCDILQASCGMHNSDWMTWTHPCGFLPPNHNMFIADTWKKSGRITRCLISTIGGLTNLTDCEKVLAAGSADFVVVAREFIADLDWIKKDLAGHPEDVTPCIKCMRCHDSDNYAQHLQCAVNPRAGLEAPIDRIPAKPEREKNVAVIGGVWDLDNASQSPNPHQGRHCKPPRKIARPKAFQRDFFRGEIFCFDKVEGLTVRDVTFRNPTTSSLQMTRTSYFVIDGVTFDFDSWNPIPLNMDGVHCDGGCHHGKISNLRGTCFDDLVALNANDGICAAYEGPITDIDIDGIYADYCHSAVRLLSAGAELKRVTIRNVHGNTEHKGKRPGVIEYTVNEEEKKTDDAASAEDKISALRAQLKEAIEKENFERAAQLRDEIKGLEG